jgi:RNA polymerase sigma factor (sigma-70 family)
MLPDVVILGPKVREHVEWAARRAPVHLRQDARQEAWLGVMKAARTFDDTRGCSFESFCDHRARGQVLDFLRREDPLHERQRARVTAGLDETVSFVPLIYVDIEKSRPPAQFEDALSADLRAWIDLLPSEDRFVLLDLLEGVRPSEVAQQLRVEPCRISYIMQRSVRQIQRKLGDRGVT